MPEPVMPMEADGSRQANAERGMDWANRVTWDIANENAVNAGDGTKLSKSYDTVLESETTSDGMREVMETETFQAISRYIATTNQGDVDNALATIRKNGYQKSMDDFIQAAEAGNVGSELVARGALLMKAANDLGRMRDFTDLYIAYKTIGTKAGQTVQAMQIYDKLNRMVGDWAAKLTPADTMYLMEKSVEAYNKGLETKKHLFRRQRETRLEIDPALRERFLEAETEEERSAAKAEIQRSLYEQAPSSWVEKLNSARYFAMLFNPRTHIRNISSNAVSVPVVLMKDKVAQGMEYLLTKTGRMEQGDRTKSSLDLRKGSQDRINMAWAADYYDKNLRDDAGDKWYERGDGSEIDRNKTIFKRLNLFGREIANPLEGVNSLNSKALDVEDAWVSRPSFAVAFARECKLQGITAADIETGRADAGKVTDMMERAKRYSQEMVFRESGKLANRLAEFSGKGGVLGTVIDVAFPFKRTPANILTRGWQYSPMGLVQGIAQLQLGVDQGKITAAQAVDNIAKGVTGTGLMALGYGLAAMGALTGGGSDDEKQAEFDKLQGRQDFWSWS